MVAVNAHGASSVEFSQFSSSSTLELEVSGASDVKGEIQAGDTSIQISGASDLKLEGRGGDLVLRASGASSSNLEQFAVENAEVDVSGASDVIVNASGVLEVDARGGSDVEYTGNPNSVQTETSGASDVSPK